MSATIELPDGSDICAYCGSRIFEHDPICVRDCNDECGSPRFFCNYACLSADINKSVYQPEPGLQPAHSVYIYSSLECIVGSTIVPYHEMLTMWVYELLLREP